MPQAEWHLSMWSNRLSVALIQNLLVTKFMFAKCIFPDCFDDYIPEMQIEDYVLGFTDEKEVNYLK